MPQQKKKKKKYAEVFSSPLLNCLFVWMHFKQKYPWWCCFKLGHWIWKSAPTFWKCGAYCLAPLTSKINICFPFMHVIVKVQKQNSTQGGIFFLRTVSCIWCITDIYWDICRATQLSHFLPPSPCWSDFGSQECIKTSHWISWLLASQHWHLVSDGLKSQLPQPPASIYVAAAGDADRAAFNSTLRTETLILLTWDYCVSRLTWCPIFFLFTHIHESYSIFCWSSYSNRCFFFKFILNFSNTKSFTAFGVLAWLCVYHNVCGALQLLPEA